MPRFTADIERLLYSGFQTRGIVGNTADYIVRDLPISAVEKAQLVARATAMPGHAGLEMIAAVYAQHGWPGRPPIVTTAAGTRKIEKEPRHE